MAELPERLKGATPHELLDIANFINGVTLFDVWSPWNDDGFCRRSPGDFQDPKVRVWHSEPEKFGDKAFCHKTGWYWEIGFGIMGISRVANWTNPHATKEEAMNAVDSVLRQNPHIVLCE